MQLPADVSLYCPLVDAKGTAARLVAVLPEGYYHLEITVKGARHAVYVPVAQSALLAKEPEPEREPGLDIER